MRARVGAAALAGLWALAALVCCASFGSSSGDATPGADAGGDTATQDAADGAALAYCASLSPAPTFCADFDDGGLVSGWEKHAEGPGGFSAFDTTTFRSPPRSLHLGFAATDASCLYETFEHSFDLATAKLTLAFDVLTGTSGSFAGASLAVVDVVSGTGGATHNVFYVDSSGNESTLHEQLVGGDASPPDSFHAFSIIGPGAWTRVSVTIDFTSTTWEVSVGGDTKTGALAYAVGAPPRRAVLKLGIPCFGPGGAVEARYDDVTFDTPP